MPIPELPKWSVLADIEVGTELNLLCAVLGAACSEHLTGTGRQSISLVRSPSFAWSCLQLGLFCRWVHALIDGCQMFACHTLRQSELWGTKVTCIKLTKAVGRRSIEQRIAASINLRACCLAYIWRQLALQSSYVSLSKKKKMFVCPTNMRTNMEIWSGQTHLCFLTCTAECDFPITD